MARIHDVARQRKQLQNFYIWSNSSSFFRYWLSWPFSRFHWNYLPWVSTSYPYIYILSPVLKFLSKSTSLLTSWAIITRCFIRLKFNNIKQSSPLRISFSRLMRKFHGMANTFKNFPNSYLFVFSSLIGVVRTPGYSSLSTSFCPSEKYMYHFKQFFKTN